MDSALTHDDDRGRGRSFRRRQELRELGSDIRGRRPVGGLVVDAADAAGVRGAVLVQVHGRCAKGGGVKQALSPEERQARVRARASFEDKLKAFMKESEERLLDR